MVTALKGTSMMLTTRNEECVVGISGWVLLRLEQGIEIPEAALYEIVGGHFSKPVVNK